MLNICLAILIYYCNYCSFFFYIVVHVDKPNYLCEWSGGHAIWTSIEITSLASPHLFYIIFHMIEYDKKHLKRSYIPLILDLKRQKNLKTYFRISSKDYLLPILCLNVSFEVKLQVLFLLFPPTHNGSKECLFKDSNYQWNYRDVKIIFCSIFIHINNFNCTGWMNAESVFCSASKSNMFRSFLKHLLRKFKNSRNYTTMTSCF